jgi:hypothetical protein
MGAHEHPPQLVLNAPRTFSGTAYVELASLTNARVLTEVTAQLSIGMWVYPSCEQFGSAYAFVFSRELVERNITTGITTGMSYNPASGGFSAKKEQLDVEGAPFAAACDMWHFIMMVAQVSTTWRYKNRCLWISVWILFGHLC